MGEEKAKPAGVWPTVKPFVNGGASGMLATCVMIQPIDMIKVRIQLGPGSAAQVTRTMLKNEGIGAFYESSHFGVVLVHKALSITGEVLQGDSYGMAAVGIDAGVESTKNYVEDKDEWLGFFTEVSQFFLAPHSSQRSYSNVPQPHALLYYSQGATKSSYYNL
ncbi:hypothetical protein RJ640_026843 [Escallonia rubra]|uniref:Uncharacterized protein n=1 Tax=Escallonia rubra TaxID=112253 RepID=A0AA88QWE9_9ASTE|nr:hypothetical protein RJ640_026843 [Escallonia rubra]